MRDPLPDTTWADVGVAGHFFEGSFWCDPPEKSSIMNGYEIVQLTRPADKLQGQFMRTAAQFAVGVGRQVAVHPTRHGCWGSDLRQR